MATEEWIKRAILNNKQYEDLPARVRTVFPVAEYRLKCGPRAFAQRCAKEAIAGAALLPACGAAELVRVAAATRSSALVCAAAELPIAGAPPRKQGPAPRSPLQKQGAPPCAGGFSPRSRRTARRATALPARRACRGRAQARVRSAGSRSTASSAAWPGRARWRPAAARSRSTTRTCSPSTVTRTGCGRPGPRRPGQAGALCAPFPALKRVRELPPCLPRRASGRGRLPRTEPSAAPSGGWPLPGAEPGARRRAGQQGGCHSVSTGSSGARSRLPAPVARSAAPAEPAAAAAAAKAARARSCSRTTWRSTCAGTCACRPSATTSTCSARCCARRRATTRSPTSRCRPAAPVAVPSGCTGAVAPGPVRWGSGARAAALGQWRPGRAGAGAAWPGRLGGPWCGRRRGRARRASAAREALHP